MNSYVTKDRKVLDWNFKKFTYGYNFYIGDIYLGQLFRPYSKHSGWSAIPDATLGKRIDGFISRDKAADYIIDLYRKMDYSSNPNRITIFETQRKLRQLRKEANESNRSITTTTTVRD
jgi:hypothetical protein